MKLRVQIIKLTAAVYSRILKLDEGLITQNETQLKEQISAI